MNKTEVKIGSDKSFGIVFSIFFLIIALWPLIYGDSFRIWSLVVSISFLSVAFLMPHLLHPFNKIWFSFGLFLHKIINPIIMGIVYILTVIPIGLLLRLFRKDLLNLSQASSKKSYWIKREISGPSAESFKNQF